MSIFKHMQIDLHVFRQICQPAVMIDRHGETSLTPTTLWWD